MITIWLFLVLVPLFRGLCELGVDAKNPTVWPLLGTLLLAPAFVAWKGNRVGSSFARAAGIFGLVGAVLLLRHSKLLLLDTRTWADALLLAQVGLSSLGAALSPTRERGASPAAWGWIAGWSLSGILNPWLPLLGGALAPCLDSWGRWPEGGSSGPKGAGLPTFLLALGLGIALPKPFWDFGFSIQADYSMVAFAGGVALVLLLRPQPVPPGVAKVALVLMSTLYFSSFPWVSSALLGLIVGLLMPQLVSRPPLFVGGMLLGLLLSFTLHANLQVSVIRAWAWWSA